jgi:hypothetical protein
MTTLLFDVVVIAAIVAIFAVRESRRLRRAEQRTHVRARWITCPISNEPATVSFVENARGDRVEVVSCSAFRDPGAIDCARGCLRHSADATAPRVRLTPLGAKP